MKFDYVIFFPQKAWFENDKISTSVLPRCYYWHKQQCFFLVIKPLKKNMWNHILLFIVTKRSLCFYYYVKQANSENCDPPLSNKFDLEVGQRSPSRSRHGTTGKVLSQRTHMPSIKALPVVVQKLWPRLKFLWRTDRRTDGQTDEWDLMSPRFRESEGQKYEWLKLISCVHLVSSINFLN